MAFDPGPHGNPHAASEPFTPSERAGFRRDLAEAIPISGADVQGLADPALRYMPLFVASHLTRYVEHRIPAGGFIHAMLEGDFDGAEAIAVREGNRKFMLDVAYWILRYAPSGSTGSTQAVRSWLEAGR